MKNATLTVTFNAEKLDALEFHMSRKDTDLQEELNDTVQKLYEKYVPQATVNIWMIKYPVSQRYGSGRGVRPVPQLLPKVPSIRRNHKIPYSSKNEAAFITGQKKLPCTRPVLPPVCPCVGFCGRGWHLYTLAGALRTVGRM